MLITSHHYIDEKYIKQNKLMKISVDDEKYYKDIFFDNRIIYTSQKYDTTIIELKENDKINYFIS